MKANLKSLLSLLLSCFLVFTVICVLVPFSPAMPSPGLDPSWHLGLNQAISQRLTLGKDIIFTFGPYASIYTRNYHPAIDGLMLWGGLYLALGFSLALLLNINHNNQPIKLAFIFVISFFGAAVDGSYSPRDPFLYFLPLLVGVHFCRSHQPGMLFTAKFEPFASFFLLTLIGFIPLIKASTLPLCICVEGVIVFSLLLKKHYQRASIAFLIPCLSSTLFWAISGQNILNLSDYLVSTFSIISGYTAAMALSGDALDIYLYLFASIGILSTTLTHEKQPIMQRLMTAILFSLSLFITFKAAFVRHDLHAVIAGNFIILCVLLLVALIQSKTAFFALTLSIFAYTYIQYSHPATAVSRTPSALISPYTSALRGLKRRIFNEGYLNIEFSKSIAQLQKKSEIPLLEGSVDIYSWDTAHLIASGNKWNPRPTFQSYSAYTPALATANRDHLLGSDAPDHLLFKVEAINERFPALEDGASWPVLLTHYELRPLKSKWLQLSKKNRPPSTQEKSIETGRHSFGELINVPKQENLVFARIDVQYSALGRLINFLYKPPLLEIALKMKNGAIDNYQFIPDMAKSGLLVSPLVRESVDFELLYRSDQRMLSDKLVDSFSINTVSDERLWQPEFTVSFFSIDESKITTQNHSSQLAPPEIHNSDNIVKSDSCFGSVDYINGFSDGVPRLAASSTLTIQGQMGVRTGETLQAPKVAIILTDSAGKTYLIATRRVVARNREGDFRHPSLLAAGFTSTANIIHLAGDYLIAIGYQLDGKYFQCSNVRINLHATGRDFYNTEP